MRPGGEILFVLFDAPATAGPPTASQTDSHLADTEFQRHARHSQSHYSGRYIHIWCFHIVGGE